MAVQRSVKRNDQRRHNRVPVHIDTYMVGFNKQELPVTLLNLSQGGALISASVEMKSVLFRPKRYTHRPMPALLAMAGNTAHAPKMLLGSCKYLRKMPDGSFQAGFSFVKTQSTRWVKAASSMSGSLTPPPRAQSPAQAPGQSPGQSPAQAPHPGCGRAPAG